MFIFLINNPCFCRRSTAGSLQAPVASSKDPLVEHLVSIIWRLWRELFWRWKTPLPPFAGYLNQAKRPRAIFLQCYDGIFFVQYKPILPWPQTQNLLKFRLPTTELHFKEAAGFHSSTIWRPSEHLPMRCGRQEFLISWLPGYSCYILLFPRDDILLWCTGKVFPWRRTDLVHVKVTLNLIQKVKEHRGVQIHAHQKRKTSLLHGHPMREDLPQVGNSRASTEL